MDTANATTQYSWNLTSLTITNETQVLIEYRGVNQTLYTSSIATFSGTSLQNVVNALNTLNLGYFFITTSGGNSFLNNYNQNIIFRNLNIYAPSLINPSFFSGTAFNSFTLRSNVLYANNSILVVGGFQSYDGTNSNGIIKLDSTGSVDTSFNVGTGFNTLGGQWALNLIAQSNSKYVLVGTFASYNGSSVKNIVGLNQDGTINTSFVTGTGLNNDTYAIAVQNDDKVIVGGFFTSYNGNASNRIIRLNSNGSVDSSFNIGTGFNGAPVAIYIQNDGKVLVGGNFTSYNGTATNNIIRLNSNGSVDTSFVYGTGVNNDINSITVDTSGRILLGGAFTTYNGTTTNRIVRLNSNGSIETAATIGFQNQVNDIEIQNNGKIIVVGTFSQYNNISANGIVRLNDNFSIDTSWDYGTGLFTQGGDITFNSNQTSMFVVGSFIFFNGISQNYISNLLL